MINGHTLVTVLTFFLAALALLSPPLTAYRAGDAARSPATQRASDGILIGNNGPHRSFIPSFV